MSNNKCAKCGGLVHDQMVFVKDLGWVCQDCAIDAESRARAIRIESKAWEGR